MRLFVPWLFAAALLLPRPSEAIDLPRHGVYLGVYGGAQLVLEDWAIGEAAKLQSIGYPEHSALFGVRVGAQIVRWLGVEVQIDLLPLSDKSDGALAQRYSLNAVLQPWRDIVSPYLTVGGGFYRVDSDALGSDLDYAMSVGLGLRAFVAEWMAIRLEGINIWTDGPGHVAYVFAGVAGLDFFVWRSSDDQDDDGVLDWNDGCVNTPGPAASGGCPDKDGDTIADRDDACPAVKGPRDLKGCPDTDGDSIIDKEDRCPENEGEVRFQGCPDGDGDGLVDLDDKCPKVPGIRVLNGCPDTDGDGVGDGDDGCPKVPGPKQLGGCPDSDGDGVGDSDDKCPKIAGPKALGGCPDADGDGVGDADDKCPKVAGPPRFGGCPDADGDGTPDADDACPKTAGSKATKGCPDKDGDGIMDSKDACPKAAGPPKTQGCPDMDNDGVVDKKDKCPKVHGLPKLRGCPPKELKKFTGAIKGIYFKTGSAKIKEKSFKLLAKAAKVLNKYPKVRLSIEGHTDSQGGERSNQRLSEARAKSVVAFLVDRGVDAKRLEAVGHGEAKPVASNKSKRGRAKNRRIEFRIISQ